MMATKTEIETELCVAPTLRLEALQEFKSSLGLLKKAAVKADGQSDAKEIWCLEQVVEAHLRFRAAFEQLKRKDFYGAWCTFEQVELTLHFAEPHYKKFFATCGLEFVQHQTEQFQALYPYKLFLSPELLELEKRCSICRSIVHLRKPCGHLTGEIYNGELCIREVTDLRVVGVAIVQKPVQRYSVVFTVDPATGQSKDHYDYALVKYVSDRIESPYDGWEAIWTKRRHPHQLFKAIGRNEKCPCESGKKYKKCCLREDGVLRPHCEIIFEKQVPPELMQIEYGGYVPADRA